MEAGIVLIVAVVLMALFFDFTNGWNDAANAIATVVSTRALPPLVAVAMSAVLNLAGAFYSTAVAKMIGGGLVDQNHVTQWVVLAAMIGATAWNGGMTLLGLPVSGSHALIGGLLGAALAFGGLAVIKFAGILTVLAAMLLSPVLGGLTSFTAMRIWPYLLQWSKPAAVRRSFRWLQVLSAAFMSFSHGASDAQKTMGVITLALFAGGFITSITVPTWVIFAAGFVMGLGTLLGGWRVIKTLGMHMSRIDTLQGFTAETATATLLTVTAGLGIPVSTTHTITGSIIGVAAAHRFTAVRWGVTGKILYAWLFTLPGAATVAYLSFVAMRLLGA